MTLLVLRNHNFVVFFVNENADDQLKNTLTNVSLKTLGLMFERNFFGGSTVSEQLHGGIFSTMYP